MRSLEQIQFEIGRMAPHLTNAGYLGDSALRLIDELLERSEEYRKKLNDEIAKNSIMYSGLLKINEKIQNLDSSIVSQIDGEKLDDCKLDIGNALNFKTEPSNVRQNGPK